MFMYLSCFSHVQTHTDNMRWCQEFTLLLIFLFLYHSFAYTNPFVISEFSHSPLLCTSSCHRSLYRPHPLTHLPSINSLISPVYLPAWFLCPLPDRLVCSYLAFQRFPLLTHLLPDLLPDLPAISLDFPFACSLSDLFVTWSDCLAPDPCYV